MTLADDPDYILEIGGQKVVGPNVQGLDSGSQTSAGKSVRNYISVLFECCHIYQRIYKNRSGTAYEGCCPRCMRPVKIKVGPSGTSNRFFRAT